MAHIVPHSFQLWIVSSVSMSPFFYSAWVLLFQCVCVFFFNFSVTSRHRRKISFRVWKNMKDGWVEEYDCISAVLFEIQMDDGNTERENRRYTFVDFVVAANYLHKQISTETNSTRQEYFAVPTMQSSLVQSDSSNPFSPTSPLSFWHIMISGLLR